MRSVQRWAPESAMRRAVLLMRAAAEEYPMPKSADVGQLVQTSYWLAQTLSHVVQFHAGLAALDPASRAQSENTNFARLADAENRLALAIEAFGEATRNGDGQRVERIIAELEVPYGVSKRPRARRSYPDLIRWRADGRALRRRLERLRRQLGRTGAEGLPARERRRVRAEIRTLEEVLG